MKSNQEMFSAKLKELDRQYEKIRERLSVCQRDEPDEIFQELKKAEDEFTKRSALLKKSIKRSRSPAVSMLAAAQLAYKEETEKLLHGEIAGLLHSEASSADEDQTEAAALFTEYAIDFASLSVDYALLLSLSVIASEKKKGDSKCRKLKNQKSH